MPFFSRGTGMSTLGGFGWSPNTEEMFDPAILQTEEIQKLVPDGVSIRPLLKKDYNTGFLAVLSQLTSVGKVDQETFNDRFESMRATRPKSFYVVVAEDKTKGTCIGSATLVIEWKFIHGCGCRGRVEDVVVDSANRGLKLGSILNKILVILAKQVGVYKLSLECKDALIPFYEHFGYKKDLGNNFLVQRFDQKSNL